MYEFGIITEVEYGGWQVAANSIWWHKVAVGSMMVASRSSEAAAGR